MKKLFSLCIALTCLVGVQANSANAAVLFGLPVDFNLATGAGGAYNGAADIKSVNYINISGIAVSDMTDTDGSGGVSIGDTTQTIAGGQIDNYQSFANGPTLGVGQITAVFTGTGMVTSLGPGANDFVTTFDSMTLQLFIQDANAITLFNPADPTTWDSGDEFISFEIAGPFNGENNAITFRGVSSTGNTVVFGGLAEDPPPLDILRISDGGSGTVPSQSPLFLTRLSTQDDPSNIIAGLFTTAVTNNTNGVADQLDALWTAAGQAGTFSDGFNGGISPEVDLAAILNGDEQFAIVPEPSSFVLLSLGGVALVGVAARRRRNAKKVA